MYFPEEKSAYLPAALEFGLLIVIVFATFRWIRRIAKRQEDSAKQLEARALKERDERMAKELQQ